MNPNGAVTQAGGQLKLVYIIGTYPLLTTTFIDREIQTLRTDGVDLHVVSVRRPSATMPLSSEQLRLQSDVQYLLPVDLGVLLLAHLYFAVSRPFTFLGTLAYLLTRKHPSLQARWKTLLHFGQGVYTAYLLRQRKFAELHAHFLDRAATIALVAGRLLRVPYSLSIHAGADIYVHPTLIREKLAGARKAVTCTDYNKAHLEKMLHQDLSDKITCIRHGLDGSFYLPQPAKIGESNLILAVGQLTERKGFAQLIEACSLLKGGGVAFECQIIGEGPQRRNLEELIKARSLKEQVKLSGALPHDQVIQKYSQAALFVMPCIQTADGDVDGIPNVLLEAMAMQVPVISTDVSAIPELVKNEWNGLLVPPNDAEALSQAIARLLADRPLQISLAWRGRQSVLADFNVETNVHRFFDTLWAEGTFVEGQLS